MSEAYPKSFQSGSVGSLWNFDHKNASGCQLASVGPRNLTQMIKYYILSMGMGFYYSKIYVHLCKEIIWPKGGQIP